jgi:3-(3-hydroxy-phenyl)propionate hydroxylase
MEGGRSVNSYVVVDVAEDPSHPLKRERLFHYEHPAVGHRNVLLVPFVGGWRIDLQCEETDDPEHFSGREGVKTWLPQVMPAEYAERISWVSTYQFLHMVAQCFADPHHRILLAGDAAHLFAPFGARGMNSGIADAVAAAFAIDRALSTTDLAAASLAIAHFALTRRAAAEHNCAASYQALMHMQARGPARRAKRLLAGLLAPYSQRAGTWLDAGPYGPGSGPAGFAAGSK